MVAGSWPDPKLGMAWKAEKLSPSAGNDPEGPRLLPHEQEAPKSPRQGFGWVSLADIAMKVWEATDLNTANEIRPKLARRPRRWRAAGADK